MATYEVTRSTTVQAPPQVVHGLVEELRAWQRWSPWEGLDDDLERTYSGPERGAGAAYAWSGNRRAGQGSMEVVESTPGLVAIDLHFLKPFRSRSRVEMRLSPSGTGTAVTWAMGGEQQGLAALLGKVVPMDTLIGKDFERGLAQLKSVAEQTARDPSTG